MKQTIKRIANLKISKKKNLSIYIPLYIFIYSYLYISNYFYIEMF